MMVTCASLRTGSEFLSRTSDYIDCQAQHLGQSGYLALATPGSFLQQALTLLITLFIAFYGIRMLLGRRLLLSDAVIAALKIGIVLTLATSWPTVRTLVFNTVIIGPDEIAGAFGLSGTGEMQTVVGRLQTVDDNIVELTKWGTGRLDITVASAPDGTLAAEAFRGAALGDNIGFGLGRYAFLTGVLAPWAIIRLGAGLLIALTPLFAGLLLFDATRNLFIGWARTLVALALSSIALAVVLNIEVGLIEPWLNDALSLRSSNYAVAGAPIELLVLASSFAIASFGLMFVIARLCFTDRVSIWLEQAREKVLSANKQGGDKAPPAKGRIMDNREAEPSRAYVIAEAVANNQRRERTVNIRDDRGHNASGSQTIGSANSRDQGSVINVPLGQSYRNIRGRVSGLGAKRDARS